MCDIDGIEPLNGTKFSLLYRANPIGSNLPLLGKLAQRQFGKVEKEEEFSSRHIAELKDALEQIQELIE